MTITNLSSSIELSADSKGVAVINVPDSGTKSLAFDSPYNGAWKIELSGNSTNTTATFQGRLMSYDNASTSLFYGTCTETTKAAWSDYTQYYMYVFMVPASVLPLSNMVDGVELTSNLGIGLYFSDAWGINSDHHPSGTADTM